MNKIDVYLNILNETQCLSEDIGIDLPNVNKGLVQKINKSIDKKDPIGSMKKIKTFIPTGFKLNAISKAETYLSKNVKNFGLYKSTTSAIIKNSVPGISPKMLNAASGFLAFSSMLTKKEDKNKNPKMLLKMNIKKFVTECRKFGEDHNDEETMSSKMRPGDLADLSVAWVIICMGSAAAIGVIGGVLTISGALATFIAGGALTSIFVVLIIFAFIFGVIWLATGFFGSGG